MLLFALVVILAVVSVSLAHETGHAHAHAHAHEHSLLASQIKFSHGKALHTHEITLKNGEKKTVSRLDWRRFYILQFLLILRVVFPLF